MSRLHREFVLNSVILSIPSLCHPDRATAPPSCHPDRGPERPKRRDLWKACRRASTSFHRSLDSLPASPFGLRRDKPLARDDRLPATCLTRNIHFTSVQLCTLHHVPKIGASSTHRAIPCFARPLGENTSKTLAGSCHERCRATDRRGGWDRRGCSIQGLPRPCSRGSRRLDGRLALHSDRDRRLGELEWPSSLRPAGARPTGVAADRGHRSGGSGGTRDRGSRCAVPGKASHSPVAADSWRPLDATEPALESEKAPK